MTGQKKIPTEKLLINVENSKILIVQGVRCQRRPPAHFFLKVSFDEKSLRAWFSQNPSRNSKHINATNKTKVTVLHVRLCVRLRLAHIAFCYWSTWSFHRLSSPLFPVTFCSGTSKRKWETAAWTIDALSAWDEAMSSSRMTLFSDVFAVQLEEFGYYMVDL